MKLNESLEVILIVSRMKDNSSEWENVNTKKRQELHAVNNTYAKSLREKYGIPVVYDENTGNWYVGAIGGMRLYDLY